MSERFTDERLQKIAAWGRSEGVELCQDLALELLELRAARASQGVEDPWNYDMEAAPEFKTVLVYLPVVIPGLHNEWVTEGSRDHGKWIIAKPFLRDRIPTAWKPLPAPPSKGNEVTA